MSSRKSSFTRLPAEPCQGSAEAPHLTWSPVRGAYPRTGAGARISAVLLAGLATLGGGRLMGRALWAGQGGARGRKAINLVLIDPPQVYEVKFQDDHLAFKPLDNGGSGGRPEGQDLRRQRFGNPLELAATPLAEPPPMDLDASTLAMPGLILTDSAEGVARAGRGNGQGTGYGRGQGHDAQFLSSDHTDGPALALADMTVEHREIPNFPKLAKMAHLAGTVVVLVTVSETGTPQAMELVSSSSPVFTQEVQRVVPLWRFKPVMAEGRAARVRVRLVFIFTYDDGTLSG